MRRKGSTCKAAASDRAKTADAAVAEAEAEPVSADRGETIKDQPTNRDSNSAQARPTQPATTALGAKALKSPLEAMRGAKDGRRIVPKAESSARWWMGKQKNSKKNFGAGSKEASEGSGKASEGSGKEGDITPERETEEATQNLAEGKATEEKPAGEGAKKAAEQADALEELDTEQTNANDLSETITKAASVTNSASTASGPAATDTLPCNRQLALGGTQRPQQRRPLRSTSISQARVEQEKSKEAAEVAAAKDEKEGGDAHLQPENASQPPHHQGFRSCDTAATPPRTPTSRVSCEDRPSPVHTLPSRRTW